MEVPKLSLPTDQGLWVGHGEPKVEPQDCVLTQGAVAHCVLGLTLRDVGEWSV